MPIDATAQAVREAERAFWRAACAPGRHAEWLWNFARIAWGIEWNRSRPIGRWLYPPVHRPYAAFLQTYADAWRTRRMAGTPGKTRIMSILPRGTAKTLLAGKCLPLALQVEDPNLVVYIGSETHDLAKDILAGIKGVMDGSDDRAWFTWLYGNWASEKARNWSQDKITHAARTMGSLSEPSFGSFGVDAGIVGRHPQVVVLDDLVSQERYGPPAVEAAMTCYSATTYAAVSDALILFNGTRYGDDDIIHRVLMQEGIASWDGMECPRKELTPNGGLWHVYFLQGEDPNGVPVIPTVWPANEMAVKKRGEPMFFACQIQNDPMLGGHQPLTTEYVASLVVPRTAIPLAAIKYATIHCDTALKDPDRRKTGDHNAIVTWFHDMDSTSGRVYLHRVQTDQRPGFASKSGQWTWAEFKDALIDVLAWCQRKRVRVLAITDERSTGGRGDATYEAQLRAVIQQAGLPVPRLLFFQRDRVAGTGKNSGKVRRLYRTASLWADGYVRLFDDAENRGLLEREMLTIEQSPHDDVADAASDVFHREVWTAPVGALSEDDDGGLRQPGDDILKGMHRTIGDIVSRIPTDHERETQEEISFLMGPRRGVGGDG